MAKILIISDIHGNWQALQTIVNDQNYDMILSAGDFVDFGPQPKEVIDFFKNSKSVGVMGNHDWGVINKRDPGSTNEVWRSICLKSGNYTRKILGEDRIRYIENLPFEIYVTVYGIKFYIVHGGPSNHLGKYIEPSTTDEVLEREFAEVDAQYIIVGHTHLPMIRKIKKKVIINPGSVGQPKDGNPETSYAFFDDGGISIKRKHYDINKTLAHYTELTFNDKELRELALALKTGCRREYLNKKVPRPKICIDI